MSDTCVIHIVDDDEPVRTALIFALGSAGFRIEGYVDASDFLARRQAGRGILISDVRMPGISGIELTRQLKRDGSTMPIILITGHADRALQAEAISAGANAVLEKPLALAALLTEIARINADGDDDGARATSTAA